MKLLEKLGSVPVRHELLLNLLGEYRFPNNKILNLLSSGILIRLKRGMYVLSPEVIGQRLSSGLIANHLLGPSYVSMESALSWYGMIPERAFSTTSLSTSRAKVFRTPVGQFIYVQTTLTYFSVGLLQASDPPGSGQNNFLIATPEKSLCDQLVNTKRLNLSSQAALSRYLFEDMRIDSNLLRNLNISVISECIPVAKKPAQLVQLEKLLKKIK